MPRYLVSGIAQLVSDVAAVLQEHDVDVVEVDDLADVPGVCADAGPAAFDGYIQLPAFRLSSSIRPAPSSDPAPRRRAPNIRAAAAAPDRNS